MALKICSLKYFEQCRFVTTLVGSHDAGLLQAQSGHQFLMCDVGGVATTFSVMAVERCYWILEEVRLTHLASSSL